MDSYVGIITGTDGKTGLIGSTLYGTCSSSASTVAKIGTLSEFDTLLTGVTIHIKFTNSNTATDPTLNVNSTGAKRIFKNGSTSVGKTVSTSWAAGSVVSLTYDGNAWQMNDHTDNTDTDTKVTQVPISDTDTSTYRIILSNTGTSTQQTDVVSKSDSLLYKPSTGELIAPKLILSNSTNPSSILDIGILPTIVGGSSESYKMLKIFNNNDVNDADIFITPSLSGKGSLGHSSANWNNVYAINLYGELNGTIASNTTATTQSSSDNSTKVATTAFVKSYNPSSLTVTSFTSTSTIGNLRIPFSTSDSTSGAMSCYLDNGFSYNPTKGTTSVEGRALLALGNSIASGTANNQKGTLRLYTESTGYIDICPTSTTSNPKVTIPAIEGNAAIIKSTEPTTFTNATYRIGYINATNRDTVITDPGIRHRFENGTTSTVGANDIMLGNSTPSGTAGNRMGMITLYTETDRYVRLFPNPNNYGNNVTLRLPAMNAYLTADVSLYSTTSPDKTSVTTSAYATYSYTSFKVVLYINGNSLFTCEIYGIGYHQIVIPTGMSQSSSASFRLTNASINVSKGSDNKYVFTLTKGKSILISGSTVTTETNQPTIYFKTIMGICRD